MDAQPAGEVASKGRVLVADDEIQILRAFSRVLEHAGYEVTVASTGLEANKLVEDDRFDVLFADIAMPEMTGLELLRRARRVTPSLPVVLVTGSPAVETAMEAIEYSVYRYLVKPVDPTELIAIAEKATLLHRMLELRRDTRDAEDLVALTGSFESALARVWMAFQPIVRPDGTTFGFEALLRSDEPALPHPGAMLDAAERLGRLHDLGRVVRQRATNAFASVDSSSSLFVNLHTHDLLDDRLLSSTSPLARIAERVVLEITERAALSDVKDLRMRVNALRDLGFRIAIDDLGAGYSALTSFPLLEPDIVKIDMSLVRDIDSQPMKRKLVGSMAALCREMKITVVGEGVETREERDVLVDLGCDLLQGYLIARPAHPTW